MEFPYRSSKRLQDILKISDKLFVRVVLNERTQLSEVQFINKNDCKFLNRKNKILSTLALSLKIEFITLTNNFLLVMDNRGRYETINPLDGKKISRGQIELGCNFKEYKWHQMRIISHKPLLVAGVISFGNAERIVIYDLKLKTGKVISYSPDKFLLMSEAHWLSFLEINMKKIGLSFENKEVKEAKAAPTKSSWNFK